MNKSSILAALETQSHTLSGGANRIADTCILECVLVSLFLEM